MTGKSPQFRIGNGYDTDDLEEDWFWDMQLQQDIWGNVCYNVRNTDEIQPQLWRNLKLKLKYRKITEIQI